jgi:hypothetical protein
MRLRFHHESSPRGADPHCLRVVSLPAKDAHAPDEKIEEVTLYACYIQSFAGFVASILGK